jgi:hypothetical protein
MGLFISFILFKRVYPRIFANYHDVDWFISSLTPGPSPKWERGEGEKKRRALYSKNWGR